MKHHHSHSSMPLIARVYVVVMFVVLFIQAGISACAQGGSNYSIFGLGDMRRSVGAAYEGVGGCMTSVPLDNTINLGNPALWTLVKTTRLQGGYRFNQQRVTQGDASVGQNNGKLDGASVIFALDTTEGISASIGIFPSSSVNYLFTKNVSVSLPDSGQYIKGKSTYAGSGGLVTGYVGGAWSITPSFSIGASGLFHFGRITDKIETSIYSQDALTSYVSNSDQLSAYVLPPKSIIKQLNRVSWLRTTARCLAPQALLCLQRLLLVFPIQWIDFFLLPMRNFKIWTLCHTAFRRPPPTPTPPASDSV